MEADHISSAEYSTVNAVTIRTVPYGLITLSGAIMATDARREKAC
jgi:hypothetical protein